MMKNVKLLAVLCLFFGLSGYTLSQDPTPSAPTLNQQFVEAASDMGTYDGYRMMKSYKVEGFWKSVRDSMASTTKVIADQRQKNEELKAEIGNLQHDLGQVNTTNKDLEYAGTHIDVLGLSFPKAFLLAIVGIIIGALIAFIITLLLTNRSSHRDKKEVAKLYRDLFSEFETYKHNALEKQIKLSRELQDYRNRYDERFNGTNPDPGYQNPHLKIGH